MSGAHVTGVYVSCLPCMYGENKDRQMNSLTPYTGVSGFFPSVKFATSLLTALAGR